MATPRRHPVQAGPEAPVPDHVRAALQIDLAALQANWQTLKNTVGSADCASVVKANAYGLGIDKIAPALSAIGCRTFFVASLDEGLALRQTLPAAVIYVFDGSTSQSAGDLNQHNLRPVLSSIPQIEVWTTYCRTHEANPPAAIMFDTGMNRLGLSDQDVLANSKNAEQIATLNLTAVMSHLACADVPNHPKNQIQRLAFETIRKKFNNISASLTNSAGIFLGTDYHFDLVRPGIALYGGNPSPAQTAPMRTVATLYARILQTRTVTKGETAGYGATWQSATSRKLATVACGYADGYFRIFGARTDAQGATAYIAGHPAPVVGQVSMDLATIDITNVPETLAAPGAWVELIGPNANIDGLADLAGTISYEILTGLGARPVRLYLDGSS